MIPIEEDEDMNNGSSENSETDVESCKSSNEDDTIEGRAIIGKDTTKTENNYCATNNGDDNSKNSSADHLTIDDDHEDSNESAQDR